MHLLAALMLPLLMMGRVGAADEFLDPDVAFRSSVSVTPDGRNVVVHWTIADGYHLYADKLAIKPVAPDVKLGPLQKPAGEVMFDETLKTNVEKHKRNFEMSASVLGAPQSFEFVVHSQGCAAAGLCYPPQTRTMKVALPAAIAGSPSAPSTAESSPSDEARIERALMSGSLLQVAGLFLLLGLLLSFTPCVLPMVPILSSIIAGQQQTVTRGRGLVMAAAYSLGMAIVYTALGVAAGLAGEGLAAALQHPAVLAGFATLLFLLALSMFDVYQLQMPAFIQTRLTGASSALPGGRFASVFVMGAMSALVVGPCVAAPLAGALVYISKTRDVLLGGTALFAMACGMSVPLLLTGFSAGSLLPRAGAWMNVVKAFFGVLLIAVAIWMVSPILPAWTVMAAWGTLAIVVAVFLKVFDNLPQPASGTLRLGKALGVLLFVAGVLQIAGVAIGGGDPLRPLAGLAQGQAASGPRAAGNGSGNHGLTFTPVSNVAQLDSAIASSRSVVAVDFYADWCVSCKEMETFTFTDSGVREKLGRLTLLRIDVTRNDGDARALMKRFGLFGPPGLLFIHPREGEISGSRVVGYKKADEMLKLLEKVLTRAPAGVVEPATATGASNGA